MPQMKIAALVLVAALAGSAANSTGSDECCAYCGCHNHLRKVCRLVCETKKVPVTHYDVKCEDICLPGHSHKCGCEWIPSCGRIKTIKKLVKIETTKEVPAYKCIVETICGDCCNRLAAADQQDADQPAKVQVAGRAIAAEAR